jgi:hypothetical protein
VVGACDEAGLADVSVVALGGPQARGLIVHSANGFPIRSSRRNARLCASEHFGEPSRVIESEGW